MTTGRWWSLIGALWLGCLLGGGGAWHAAAATLSGVMALGLARQGHQARAWLPPLLLALAVAGMALAGVRADWRDQAVSAVLARERAHADLHAVAVSDARHTPFDVWQLFAVTRINGTRTRERIVLRMAHQSQAVPWGAGVRAGGRLAPLGRSGFDGYLRSRHAVAELRAADVTVIRPPPPHLRAAERVRQRSRSAFTQALGHAHAAVLLGLTVGVNPPGEIAARFDGAGLSHVLVVSGQHAVVTVAVVLRLAAGAGLGFFARRFAALLGLAWLVVLVRPQPSVLRAAGALTLVLLAQLMGRPGVGLHLLGSAVVVLLLADPELARQAGFQLSVAASFGLLALAGPLRTRLGRDPPSPRSRRAGARLRQAVRARLRMMLAATLAAQLLVTPVLWATVGSAPLLTVPANLAALPLVAAAQLAGMSGALAAQVHLGAGIALSRLAGPPVAALTGVAALFARGPSVPAPTLLPPGLGALRQRLPEPVARWSGVLPAQVGTVTLTALDVGQGDAFLVEAPGPGRAARMLVDAGADPELVRRQLQHLGVAALDLVVMTHADLDHSGGLAAVLHTLPVGVLLVGPQPPLDPGSAAWRALQAAQARGVAVRTVYEGQRMTLGAAQIDILSPPPGGFAADDHNAHSVVMRVRYQGRTLLLTGDAEAVAQQRLLRRPDRLRAHLLQVPHHGGRTNADGFLAAVRPCVAVISVGLGNRYGHPHPDVLDALGQATILRTDLRGRIRVPLGPAVDC